jgi:hypothetical protein
MSSCNFQQKKSSQNIGKNGNFSPSSLRPSDAITPAAGDYAAKAKQGAGGGRLGPRTFTQKTPSKEKMQS